MQLCFPNLPTDICLQRGSRSLPCHHVLIHLCGEELALNSQYWYCVQYPKQTNAISSCYWTRLNFIILYILTLPYTQASEARRKGTKLRDILTHILLILFQWLCFAVKETFCVFFVYLLLWLIVDSKYVVFLWASQRLSSLGELWLSILPFCYPRGT